MSKKELFPKRFSMNKINNNKKLSPKIGDPGWLWDHLRFDSDVLKRLPENKKTDKERNDETVDQNSRDAKF